MEKKYDLTNWQWDVLMNAPAGRLEAISEELGINYNSARRLRSQYRRDEANRQDGWAAGLASNVVRVDMDDLPDPVTVKEQPLHIYADRLLYVCDAHAPRHCKRTLNRVLAVAETLGIDDLVWGGDTFDLGGYSSHEPEFGEELEDEHHGFKVAGAILRRFSKSVKRQWIVPGNHDARKPKRGGVQESFGLMVWGALGMAGGLAEGSEIKISNYDFVLLNDQDTPEGWSMGHPRWHSSIPGKKEAEIAMKIRRNVCSAHTHLLGATRSADSRFWGVSPGCATRIGHHFYAARSAGLSAHKEWVNGFVLIEGPRFRLMTDGQVNWEREFDCE
jgi:hypothetical protein